MRIETLTELKARIETIFGKIGVAPAQMSAIGDYGVMFSVQGKLKALLEMLKTQSDPDFWDCEASFCAYRNTEENFLLTLKSAPRMILCMASVISLHEENLKKYE